MPAQVESPLEFEGSWPFDPPASNANIELSQSVMYESSAPKLEVPVKGVINPQPPSIPPSRPPRQEKHMAEEIETSDVLPEGGSHSIKAIDVPPDEKIVVQVKAQEEESKPKKVKFPRLKKMWKYILGRR